VDVPAVTPLIPRQIRQLWITRFDFLAGLLPHGIEPSDIDQALERHGHLLFIECKRRGQGIPRGQEILFDALLDLADTEHRVCILVIEGDPPDGIRRYAWWFTGATSQTLDWRPTSLAEIRAKVQCWYEKADAA
jgi:hypothetical protein